MRIPLYQIDSFAAELFRGNPAAVCPLEEWLDDETLRAIAAENNLSETAFLVPEDGAWRLRWFTPSTEVDLCGHATLAAAWVLFERERTGVDSIRFLTRGGPLTVTREEGRLVMDFPSRPPRPKEAPRALIEGLGAEPEEVRASERDYLVRYAEEDEVRKLRPDFGRLRTLDRLGVIVTAPGTGCDFVSRFFAPSVGVQEDPVTGSAHCTLAPFWAERLEAGESWMEARQLSTRGGRLACRVRGDRVDIAGRAILYLEGTIHLP